MRYSAVLFDMDGVVIDTHHSVTAFWNDLANQHQVQLADEIFAQHIYGTPAMHTLATCFPQLSPVECQAVLESLTRYENQLAYTEVPGVIGFIRSLRQNNIQTALVTSAEPRKVQNVLNQLGLHDLFSATVTSNDVKKGKPDPQCYLLGASHLKKSPEQCIVFEDAISGVKAAVAAGTTCIGIQQAAYAAPLFQVGARYVAPDFTVISLDASHTEDDSLHLRIGTEQPLLFTSD